VAFIARCQVVDDVHTIFRMAAFIHHAIGKAKVEALAQHYGQWHAAIEPINAR
jgi:hypothetical protein